MNKCPQNPAIKSDAFYLTSLKKPKKKNWFSFVPVGYNILGITIQHICAAAGIIKALKNESFTSDYSCIQTIPSGPELIRG